MHVYTCGAKAAGPGLSGGDPPQLPQAGCMYHMWHVVASHIEI